jgi:glycosyltransferase involved in cell wall biosynthesis
MGIAGTSVTGRASQATRLKNGNAALCRSDGDPAAFCADSAVDLAPVPARILLLVTDLHIGGTPTVVRELAWRLSATGEYSVHVACLGGWGAMADQIRDLGLPVTALHATGTTDLAVGLRLANLIHAERSEIVFSFLLHANAVAAAVRPMFEGVRFLQGIQTTQREPRWHWAVQRLAQHMAEKIVVPSESAARAAQNWAGAPRRKIVVIPNAVDIPKQSSAESRAGGMRIGFIGRLDPVKRVGDLLAAMPLLPEESVLHVFGDGRDRFQIEWDVRQMRLQNRVVMHGTVARSAEALAMLDALVLPSEAEGFGLVLIEAMAAGVPVVATNVPGIRDVVRDGENGLLAPVRDPAAIAAAIGRIFGEGNLRDRLIDGGRRAVADRYTWEKVLPQYLALLNAR